MMILGMLNRCNWPSGWIHVCVSDVGWPLLTHFQQQHRSSGERFALTPAFFGYHIIHIVRAIWGKTWALNEGKPLS